MSLISITPRKRMRIRSAEFSNETGDNSNSYPSKVLSKEQSEYRSIVKAELQKNYFTSAGLKTDPFFPENSEVNSTTGRQNLSTKNTFESAMDLIQKAYIEVNNVGELSKILQSKQGDIKITTQPNFPNIYTKIPESKIIEFQRESLSSISSNIVDVGILDSLDLIIQRQSVVSQLSDLKRYWDVNISKSIGISINCGYGTINSNDIPLVVEENSLLLPGDVRNFRKTDNQLKFKSLNFQLTRTETSDETDDALNGSGNRERLLGSINSWDERAFVDSNTQNKDKYNSTTFVSFLKEKYHSVANHDSAAINLNNLNNLLDIHEFCLRKQHESFCRLAFTHIVEKYASSDRLVIGGTGHEGLKASDNADHVNSNGHETGVEHILGFFGVISNSFEIKLLTRSKIVLAVSSKVNLTIELRDYSFNGQQEMKAASTLGLQSNRKSSSKSDIDVSSFLIEKLKVCCLKTSIFTYYHIYKTVDANAPFSANGLNALFLPVHAVVPDVGDKDHPLKISNSIESPFEKLMSHQDIVLPVSLINILRASIYRYITEKIVSSAMNTIFNAKGAFKFVRSEEFQTRKVISDVRMFDNSCVTYEISKGSIQNSQSDLNISLASPSLVSYQIMSSFTSFENNLFDGRHPNLFSSEYIYRMQFYNKVELLIHIAQGKFYMKWSNIGSSSAVNSEISTEESEVRAFNSSSEASRFYEAADIYHHISQTLSKLKW